MRYLPEAAVLVTEHDTDDGRIRVTDAMLAPAADIFGSRSYASWSAWLARLRNRRPARPRGVVPS